MHISDTVCLPPIPVPTISSIDTSPQQSGIRTGSSVTLTCNSNDTSAMYSWFRDGARMDSSTTNTLQLDTFLSGFYQCRAALSSGENTVYTIRLDVRGKLAVSLSLSLFLSLWLLEMAAALDYGISGLLSRFGINFVMGWSR